MKLGLLGAGGRMGAAIIKLINDSDDFILRAAIVSPGSGVLGRDVGVIHGGTELGVRLTQRIDEAVDVVIDFAPGDAFRAHLGRCREMGAALVSGATGLSADGIEDLRAAAAAIPVLHASNMCLGIAVLRDLAARAVAALPDADIEIVEAHHRAKRDAPSGTALALADTVASVRSNARPVKGRAGNAQREPEEIGISAVRGGDVVGEHTVYLLCQGERIELTHRAMTRDVFATGALNAARWIAGRPAGWYSIEDVALACSAPGAR